MTRLLRMTFGVACAALLALQAAPSARPAEALPTRRIADLALPDNLSPANSYCPPFSSNMTRQTT